MFSQLLSFSRAADSLAGRQAGAAPLVILGAMFLVLILPGMFMDPVSMMLITVPIFYPTASELGYDLIWFSNCPDVAGNECDDPPFGLLST